MDYSTLIKEFCAATDKIKYRMFEELYKNINTILTHNEIIYLKCHIIKFNRSFDEIFVGAEIPTINEYCQIIYLYQYISTTPKDIIFSLNEYLTAIDEYNFKNHKPENIK